MSTREFLHAVVCGATLRNRRGRLAPIASIAMALVLSALVSDRVGAQSVELVSSQPSGGGGISSGGEFSLIGAVAQVAAGPASGGNFDVIGGFIPACEFACTLGGVGCSGTVDADDLAVLPNSWVACAGGVACLGDLNDDGQVGPADLSMFLNAWDA